MPGAGADLRGAADLDARSLGPSRRTQLAGHQSTLGVAYDLFGTGKTAVKVSVGRYVEAVTNGYATPPTR